MPSPLDAFPGDKNIPHSGTLDDYKNAIRGNHQDQATTDSEAAFKAHEKTEVEKTAEGKNAMDADAQAAAGVYIDAAKAGQLVPKEQQPETTVLQLPAHGTPDHLPPQTPTAA